jgi:uncharacterized protein YjdB/putative cell wall-binding protein
MKKILSKIITFLFVIGIAVSGFGGSAYAASSSDESNSAGTDVSIAKDRLYGSDRIETSLKISESGWKDGADTVVIAQGYGYADALCAAPLAKKNNAPIILSRQDALSSDTVTELKRLKAKKAFVIGGTGSLSTNVESQLKSLGISDVERLGGADRYETSVKIAQAVGNSGSIVVASGEGYADSLSVAPIAAAKGMPILLTRSSSLPDAVNNYIKGIEVNKTYVVGGTGVVADSLKNSLPGAQRLGGATRFDTNLAILQNFKSDLNFDNVYIAEGNGPNGDEFADALSGAALASRKSAPLVLVYKTIATDTANFIKDSMSDKTTLVALGGISVVPDAILSGIQDLYNGKTPSDGIGEPGSSSGDGSDSGSSNPDSEHVALVIDGYKGNIVNESSLSFTKGDTVFDVLKRTLESKNISMDYEGSGGTTYVQAIDGEREFDRPQGGGKPNYSGWKYSVDGTFPNYSCGAEEETLQGGEKIHWVYVLDVWDETNFRDVDSVKLNEDSLSLKVNGSEPLEATVSPSDATDKDVVWSSSNESVAKVDDSGKVKAVGSGTATITAESVDNEKFDGRPNYDASENTDTCTVTVSGSSDGGDTDVSVTGVTLDKTSTTLEVGSTDQLTATITPSNATDKGLIWSSSDESVATVDQNGVVTGVSEGTATITVTTADGNKTAACTVTVGKSTSQSIVEIHKEGLDLTISRTAVGTVNMNSKAEDASDDITITLYDEDGNLAYINQAEGTMNYTTVLDSGKKYHGFIKASSTDKIEIPEFELNEDTVPITGVTLDKTSTTVEVGGTDKLTAAVAPADATNKEVTWSSSKESVAAVDQNGLVTGISAGTAIVTVATADGNKTAECTVTVSGGTSDPDNGQVSLVIDGYKGNIVNEPSVSFTKGDTVFDVVKRTLESKNISMDYEGSGGTTYVQAIDGEREFDRPQGGGKPNYSGWKYSVNGTFPNYSCGAEEETLQGGEKIHWVYVLDINDETNFRDVDSVKLNKDSLELDTNASETLTASVSPSDATDKGVVWSSSDESVATVDENGSVKAVGPGTATITAESVDNAKFEGRPNYDASKNKDTCTVTVAQAAKDYTSDITALINGISSNITLDNCDDWIALGLNKTGKTIPDGYLESLQQRVRDNTEGGVLDFGVKTTEGERLTLAVLASGGDPENIEGQNILSYICNSYMDQGINAYVFGLIALDSKNFDVPEAAKWTRESLVDAILGQQLSDGGWSYGGDAADPDMTAMAISALAPYKSQEEVKTALDRGIAVLSQIQDDDDGGYSSYGAKCSESSAQVIIGLCANGIDPTTDGRFIKNGKNPMDSLLTFATEDKKGFGHTNDSYNGMATEQGLEALAAYNLFKDGKGSLYSFN